MSTSLTHAQTQKSLRKAFYFVHLWVGLIFGLYFVVMGLSGSLLTLRDEFDEMANRSLFSISAPSGVAPKSIDSLVAGVKAKYPGVTIGAVTLPTEASRTLVVGYSRGGRDQRGPGGGGNRREAFVNPYTGEILGNRTAGGTFFPWVLRVHRTLLLNQLGEQVNRYAILFVLALLISGLWLWWPSIRNFGKQFKVRTTIQRGASAKRAIHDLHNVVGFYGFAILLLIAVTAFTNYWKAPTVAVVSAVTGTPMVAQGEDGRDGGGGNDRGNGENGPGGRGGRRNGPRGGGGQENPGGGFGGFGGPGGGFGGPDGARTSSAPPSYDLMIANAEKVLPKMAVLQIGPGRGGRGGGRGGGGLRITKGELAGHGVRPRVATLSMNMQNGGVQEIQIPSEAPPGLQVMGWLMPIHYGEWGYGPTYYVVKALHFLAGLTPLALFVTGILMWIEKRKGKLTNRRRREEKAKAVVDTETPVAV